jgi:superoxide reductase
MQKIERSFVMKVRREFLKGSLLLKGIAVFGNAKQLYAASKFPVGLIYTKEAPGRWAGKEGTHAPKVTVRAKISKY